VSKNIFPAEAWELISKNRESDDLVIIDVSTPQEYENLHLEGAINVNLISKFFKTRLEVMDKNKTYDEGEKGFADVWVWLPRHRRPSSRRFRFSNRYARQAACFWRHKQRGIRREKKNLIPL